MFLIIKSRGTLLFLWYLILLRLLELFLFSFLFSSSTCPSAWDTCPACHLEGMRLCEVAGVRLSLWDFPLSFLWASDFSFAAFSIFSWKSRCLFVSIWYRWTGGYQTHLDFHIVWRRFEELWYPWGRRRGSCSVWVCLPIAIERSVDGLLLLHPEAAHGYLGGCDGFKGCLLFVLSGLLHKVPVLLLFLKLGQSGKSVLEPLLSVL